MHETTPQSTTLVTNLWPYYKLSWMCYNSVTASTPQYLTDLLQIYTPSHTFQSTTATRKLKIPLFKKKYKNYILLLL